ncbi:hypothetical protein M885DRAFT_515515 [Pelagophyceae sp. CCMP2097]|nr:hypothetical protein M885DRAFT_515515 [Pelagophyceae sp. CCMP2097]
MADFDGPRGKRVLAATRLHIGDMSKAPDFTAISAFVSRFGEFVDGVAVAVGVPGAPEETALAELQALADNVREAAPAATVIPVTPWGAFTPALNALVDHAARNGYDYILFASVETACTASTISALQSHLDADAQVFVAGAALPGHAFSLGEAELSGVTCPWNTLALWRVSTLSLVGFPLVAEGLHAGVSGGVEEVSAIEAVRRVLRPGVARALLVAVPGVEWETSFDDEKRAVWHASKMASKTSRPAAQLKLFGEAQTSRVEHLEH